METYCGLALSGQRSSCCPDLCVQAVGQWPVWPAAPGPWRQRIRGGTAGPPAWPPAYGVHDDALYKSTAFTFTFTFMTVQTHWNWSRLSSCHVKTRTDKAQFSVIYSSLFVFVCQIKSTAKTRKHIHTNVRNSNEQLKSTQILTLMSWVLL